MSLRFNLDLLAVKLGATVCAIGHAIVASSLGTGRFHQIRAQMSARSHPLIGDKKYGSRDEHRRVPALFAYMLSFTVFGKKIRVSATPCTDEYPWNLFDAEIYKKAAGEENQI